jgi:hypothetical protein
MMARLVSPSYNHTPSLPSPHRATRRSIMTLDSSQQRALRLFLLPIEPHKHPLTISHVSSLDDLPHRTSSVRPRPRCRVQSPTVYHRQLARCATPSTTESRVRPRGQSAIPASRRSLLTTTRSWSTTTRVGCASRVCTYFCTSRSASSSSTSFLPLREHHTSSSSSAPLAERHMDGCSLRMRCWRSTSSMPGR